MSSATAEQTVSTLEILKEERIAAPIEIVFEALLEHLGPSMETGPGAPLRMTLEAWPGGGWTRDWGSNTGHFWGDLQFIKPPALLEICGPFCMSYPAMNHLQYRLTAEGKTTRLAMVHRAIGAILDEHRYGMPGGWAHDL